MDHAKLLDVMTSLPVSRSILPRAVCCATSRLANNAICRFIDSSGYAFGPIRRSFFLDYIINNVMNTHYITLLAVTSNVRYNNATVHGNEQTLKAIKSHLNGHMINRVLHS